MREAKALVMAVVKFAKAGLSWGMGENQQQLSVVLMLGAPSCLPDPVAAAFPFSFLLRQLLNCRSIDSASRLVPCFPSARQLAFCC